MANTTWSTTDKTASGTLSGGNLTYTTTGSNSGIRTVDKQGSGKYYFEYTMSTWSAGSTCVGVANTNAVFSTFPATVLSVAVIVTGGVVFINGVNTGISFGSRASGDVVCIALDLNTKLIWFRIGAAGNWNTSGTANPATGVGGASIVSMNPDGVLLPIYGIAGSPSAGQVITANFGDSAFTGTVPSGFTSGFPTGSPPLVAANTQTALEEWAMPNAQAQATQLAAEMWASVPAGTRTALLTQIALEQWSTLVPPVAAWATQLSLEEWVALTYARATQLALEEWSSVGPTFEYAKAAGLVRETLLTMHPGQSQARVAGLARETLLTMHPGQSQVRIGGLVREALVSGVIVPRQYAVPVS